MDAQPPLPNFETTGEIWYWRGPPPFHFVTLPETECAAIAEVACEVTYGWGVILVRLRLGEVERVTSVFPKYRAYLDLVTLAIRYRGFVAPTWCQG